MRNSPPQPSLVASKMVQPSVMFRLQKKRPGTKAGPVHAVASVGVHIVAMAGRYAGLGSAPLALPQSVMFPVVNPARYAALLLSAPHRNRKTPRPPRPVDRPVNSGLGGAHR